MDDIFPDFNSPGDGRGRSASRGRGQRLGSWGPSLTGGYTSPKHQTWEDSRDDRLILVILLDRLENLILEFLVSIFLDIVSNKKPLVGAGLSARPSLKLYKNNLCLNKGSEFSESLYVRVGTKERK